MLQTLGAKVIIPPKVNIEPVIPDIIPKINPVATATVDETLTYFHILSATKNVTIIIKANTGLKATVKPTVAATAFPPLKPIKILYTCPTAAATPYANG